MSAELKELERLAAEGDVASQVYLGWAYDRFGDAASNEERAEYWLRCASKSGSLEGQRRLARFLSQRDKPEAESVARELCNRSDFFGFYLLGHMFVKGSCGLEQNRSRALDMFSEASKLGHLVSEFDGYKFSKPNALRDPFVFIQTLPIISKILWNRIWDSNGLSTYT